MADRKHHRRRPGGKTSGRKKAPWKRGDESPPRKVRPDTDEPIRLNRYIAQSGLCSRRNADALIEAGEVTVNGEVVTALGTRVNPGDQVAISGKRIVPLGLTYLLLNKPTDTITTTSDERGRRSVLDLINLPEEEKQGLFPVGRLDRHTTGVLLITNDGALAHRLMHPRYKIEKYYRVETEAAVKPHELAMLRDGVELEDGPARADRAEYLDPPHHRVLGLLLHEGRNRQIRRMLEALGHRVVRLDRVRYAGLTSRGIRPGRWRRLEEHEIRKLQRMVKL